MSRLEDFFRDYPQYRPGVESAMWKAAQNDHIPGELCIIPGVSVASIGFCCQICGAEAKLDPGDQNSSGSALTETCHRYAESHGLIMRAA